MSEITYYSVHESFDLGRARVKYSARISPRETASKCVSLKSRSTKSGDIIGSMIRKYKTLGLERLQ